MPLYEYKCDGCGAATELLRSHAHMMDPVICECGEAMVNVIGRPSVYVWRTDAYADFGSPQYADFRRKQCGVDN